MYINIICLEYAAKRKQEHRTGQQHRENYSTNNKTSEWFEMELDAPSPGKAVAVEVKNVPNSPNV